MADLYSFRAVRSLRRVAPAAERFFDLVHEERIPPPLTVGGPSQLTRWDGGELLNALRKVAADNLPDEARASQARGLALKHLNHPGAVDESMLDAGLPGGEPFPGQSVLHFLAQLDLFLVSRNSRPEGAELDAVLIAALKRFLDPSGDPAQNDLDRLADRRWFFQTFNEAWARLVDALCAALLRPDRGELAQRITRILLVFGVVDRRSGGRSPLAAERTFALLSSRTPVLPRPTFPLVLPQAQVKLVRRATVSDLFVVRQEWRCYVPGEVADIRNVLAGEHQQQRTSQIDEREVITSTSVENLSLTETSTETNDETMFSEETRRSFDLALHADAQVDVSGQYGPTKLDFAAGFAADLSLEESTDRATEVAKRAVARASSRVENRTQSQRSERMLTRFEDVKKYRLDNDGKQVRGVYRWVNRVDRLQVWRYPDRLQLEFQLPEPGRFLLKQLREKRDDPGGVPKPPDGLDIPPEGITSENYLKLAAKYRAFGLPEPPDQTLSVAEAFTIKPAEPLNSSDSGAVGNAPSCSDRKEMALPSGYAAAKVSVSVDAVPLHGKWLVKEGTTFEWTERRALHTITASVAVGDKIFFAQQDGAGDTSPGWEMQFGSQVVPTYLAAHLHYSTPEPSDLAGVSMRIPIATTVTGASAATIAVEVSCTLTEQAKAAWRQDVYDGLWTAFDTWTREWRAQQGGNGVMLSTVAERAPGRNRELVLGELKRHVISWMLDESPFSGRSAVQSTSPVPAGEAALDPTPDISFDAARRVAPDTQFLEQCLEWANLSYVTYPYFWGDRTRWADLIDLETADPELGRFLRAGSVRVVVPARPGFAAAVQHWLLYRQHWSGANTAPVPGDPLYLSIAAEVRDQTQPPPDGVPGDSWDIVLPTTLLWLDDSDAALPVNPLARLGQPPNAPPTPLCPSDLPVPSPPHEEDSDA